MKTFGNFMFGFVGTGIATFTPEKWAAIFAGITTGLWMLRQLWLSFYPREKQTRFDFDKRPR